MSAFEILTMGRIGVDLYPLQAGVGLDQVETFGKWLGGSATNVAVAGARYGRRAAVISRTGDDPFGRFIHTALAKYGVDDRYVVAVRLARPQATWQVHIAGTLDATPAGPRSARSTSCEHCAATPPGKTGAEPDATRRRS